MINVNISSFKFSHDRKELRKQVINLFLDEDPGTGTGSYCTKYEYITKTLLSGENVFLKRPAQFNNGFDFTVHVSNINFNIGGRYTTRPTHQNIIDDLSSKKEKNKAQYQQLITQIDLIYNCLEPEITDFDFKIGFDVDLLLECVKWLFVEQDVTYWNYSGRNMLYQAILDI